ncbi:hypothetical protein Tco_0089409 [Tanacetum coccineum]
MEALKFVDSHNMVAYLEKSTENVDFDEIVDFLNANPMRYALIIENLQAVFNDEYDTPSHTKKVFTNMRREGKDETVHKERGDRMEKATTTASSLEAKQVSGDRPAQTRFKRLYKQSNDPPLSRVNIHGSGEDNMKLNELMEICTRLSERVLALENIKTT